jgi:hypothetical protein
MEIDCEVPLSYATSMGVASKLGLISHRVPSAPCIVEDHRLGILPRAR